MTSLLSATEQANLAADLDNVFSTFSYEGTANERNIVIWKEPLKVALIENNTNPQLFGFGNAPVQAEYTYIPQSGVFPAVIRYASKNKPGMAEALNDTNSFIPVGEVRIQVRQNAYNFIESGTTDKISFDNRDWYFVGKGQAEPFMGNSWFKYELRPKT